MDKLEKLSKIDGIEFIKEIHNLYKVLPDLFEKWNFIYKTNGKEISCIKGGVSFGFYEIYLTKGDDLNGDVERFETPEETISRVKEILLN